MLSEYTFYYDVVLYRNISDYFLQMSLQSNATRQLVTFRRLSLKFS